nr:hypothetical protein [Pelodictyon luteolum]
MHAEGMLQDPVSGTFIQWLHEQFYLNLPESMCQIEKQGRSLTIVPGEYRNRAEQDVSVGLHQPPSSIHVNDFMAYSMERAIPLHPWEKACASSPWPQLIIGLTTFILSRTAMAGLADC